MLKKSLSVAAEPVSVQSSDLISCTCILLVVLLQCILVFFGAGSILSCIWYPTNEQSDFDKLARVMYLYDPNICGNMTLNADADKGWITNLVLSNETYGMPVLPIKWQRAMVTVSTRLSEKTRTYVLISIALHIIWMTLAIVMRILLQATKRPARIYALTTYLYYTILVMIVFDLSMAFVYLSHIQQSLTKGMVVRYSGWANELVLQDHSGFAGWLPIIASLCWTRGVLLLCLNIYQCKVVYTIRRKITRREVRKRLMVEENVPLPEHANIDLSEGTLFYRSSEKNPYTQLSSTKAFVF